VQAGGDAPIVTSLHDLLGALCEHDTHRDGALDIDEFGELLQHTEMAEAVLPRGEQLDSSRIARMFRRADADGDGQVDFNELFAYLQPARHRKHASVAPAARIDRKVLTPAVNLLGRVAVHLAGAEEEDDEEDEDLELYDDLGGGSGSEEEDREEERWKRVAEHRRRSKYEQARGRAEAKQRAEEGKRSREADAADVAALTKEGGDYIARLRANVQATVAAGYDDHTESLTPRAMRRLCRQVQRYDTSGDGRLDFDAFVQLCAKVVAASEGGVELSSLQLLALFSQADVTGIKSICASQWCWAREQLAAIVAQQTQAHQLRLAREAEASGKARKTLAITYSGR